MKSEKGITLAVLVLTIAILLILSSFAIYTGTRSTEIIKIQKYKAQMQLIQNGVDELYEEYKNYCQKNNKDDSYKIKDYIDEVRGIELQQMPDDWEGIETFKIKPKDFEKYYCLTKEQVVTILGVSDIDISENFIINFEKRYVFSETPLKAEDNEGNITNIYTLYQLTEEEQIVEFTPVKKQKEENIPLLEKNTIPLKNTRIDDGKMIATVCEIDDMQWYTDTNSNYSTVVLTTEEEISYKKMIGNTIEIEEGHIVKGWDSENNIWVDVEWNADQSKWILSAE